MMKKKGFTLVEVIIVTLIMAIILSMTVLFGSQYLKDLQLRQEKESLLDSINYALSYVKSSNYFQGQRYEYLDVVLSSSGLSLVLDGGIGFDQQVLSFSTLSLSGGANMVRLYPYQRSCEDVILENETVYFSLESNASESQFCFERDMPLCKLFLTSCP